MDPIKEQQLTSHLSEGLICVYRLYRSYLEQMNLGLSLKADVDAAEEMAFFKSLTDQLILGTPRNEINAAIESRFDDIGDIEQIKEALDRGAKDPILRHLLDCLHSLIAIRTEILKNGGWQPSPKNENIPD